MNTEPQVTLAIEAAIAGGSLSLLNGKGSEIASWVGESTDAARSEYLLQNIESILGSTGVSKQELAMIAVSAGPGSFTGIRVGIATALGLKNGLGIPMFSTSVLEAMVTAKGFLAVRIPSETDLLFCSVVPSGRNAVCLQSFEVGNWTLRELCSPWTMRDTDLAGFIAEQSELQFLIHSDLMGNLSNGDRVTDVGRNLAYCVAQDCFANRPSTPPLFVSKSY